MRILAIDGALGGFSVALDDGSAVVADASRSPDALERGLGRIEDLLARAGLRLRDLDRIAVGTGPGSFTGLRIAVSYAKALAYGSAIPLVGVSSYDALEPESPPLPLITVVRGRRDVVCARRRDERRQEYACGPPADVLDRLLTGPPGPLAAAGDTEDVLAQIAERGWNVRALPPRDEIPAVAIAALARVRRPLASPHALAPDYGEAPAVRPSVL
jgi:tRNA threonylcarbamoyl adenosine modification protein YeaZ